MSINECSIVFQMQFVVADFVATQLRFLQT